jgi:ABC-2 type transport system ATP-binding protein
MGHARAKERALELLQQFRLEDRENALPDDLSGGMAQRLQVARAIAHDPNVLFLDEPTAGLDPQSRIALWASIQEMRERGITVLLTTHYMEEADRLCDRVAIIDHGKILVCDAPETLKRTVGVDTIIELQLDRPPDGLRAQLLQLPGVGEVDETDRGLRLLTRQANGLLPRIVELAQPYSLRDVSVTEPTLETVFIRLTGRELRD